MKTPPEHDAALKLDLLVQKRDKMLSRLNAKIAKAKRVNDAKSRKEDVREKILVGACLLAELARNPALRDSMTAAIKRNGSPRDLEFLRTRAWEV